jgi:UDP-N-acetylglucosamine/UDP-N-acetylgalactosamine diphosphorylase
MQVLKKGYGRSWMLEKRLRELGQDHILKLLSLEGGSASKERILKAMETIDAGLINRLINGELIYQPPQGVIEPADVIPASFAASGKASAYITEGKKLLKEGKTAALVVAGGQGSRLGIDAPKGVVGVTPIRRKSLFRVFAEKILALEKRLSCTIPFFIMTSQENDKDTKEYFQDQEYFGLDPSRVHFFVQGMLPSVTPEGKFILAEDGGLYMNPDGHGGTFKALRASGCLDRMKVLDIEEIFYFQVDNPLVKLCDPLFIGLHHLNRAQMSSKVVRKVSFEEKVGVFAKIDGKTLLVEYSDMDYTMKHDTSPDGAMIHWAGSIAVHVIRRDFIEDITEGSMSLPFHRARKPIVAKGSDGSSMEIEGIKFETFLFDALPLAQKTITLEVKREEEFAPVKNKTGNDSLESSIVLQSDLYRSWFEQAGVKVNPGTQLEISPLFALDSEVLKERSSELPRIIERDTYLG